MKVYLVPTRKRQRLSPHERLGEGTYGNRKLWESVRRACRCSSTTTGNGTADEHDATKEQIVGVVVVDKSNCKKKPHSCCAHCRRTLAWVAKYVPREALRIQNNVLQIKGKSMRRLVYVNDEPVKVSQGDEATNDAWVGSIPLEVGTTISFRFRSDPSMDFEVIADPQTDGNDEGLMCQKKENFEVGMSCSNVHEQENDKENFAQGQESGCIDNSTPQKLNRLESAELTSVACDPAALTPGYSEPVTSDIETPELMARLERRIERDALVWDAKQTLNAQTVLEEETPVELNSVVEHGLSSENSTSTVAISNGSGIQGPDVIDLLVEDDVEAASISKSVSIESVKPTIMFVELGRGLTRGQIRFLTTVVLRKGLKVVHTLDGMPTYMVVDAFVNVETLAQHLNFKGVNKVENLKKLVSERNITPVKPCWITNNKGPTIRPPKIMEFYNGLIVENSGKHVRLDRSNSSIPSNTKGDDLVAEVPANGGKVVRNVEIAELFRKLAKIYQKAIIETQDEFRAYTFNLVAGRLNQLDFEISSDPAAMSKLGGIPGFGGSSLGMIKEWIKTRGIERIHFLETEERRIATRNLIKIWGVGPKTAQHLYNNNIRTIGHVREGLRTNKIDLNDNQKVGVECYEDFQLPMRREEVEQILATVKAELKTLLPNASITAMGSYRRGKFECGDADILITDPGYVNCTPRLALGELVRRLMKKGHIAYNLTEITGLYEESTSDSQSSQRGGDGKAYDYDPYPTSQSYMGVFNSQSVPGVRRRIDIKLYPFRERAFASIYFTGCGWFNRSMRLWATRKKNMHLNDHGLFPDNGKGHHVPRPTEKLLYEASSEADVFDILGLVYKQPHERDCFDDVVSTDGLTVASLNIDDRTAWQVERRHTTANDNAFVDLDD